MVEVQVTVSGIDRNGFVWQNVFHLRVNDLGDPTNTVLTDVNNHVDTVLSPALANAMSTQCTILSIAAKYVGGASSYTLTKTINLPGNRDLDMDTGATAGRIAWLPATGAAVGHQYITGVCQGDFVNDFINGAYKTLLDAVKDAFLALSTAGPPRQVDFMIWNKSTFTGVAVADGYSMDRVGVLSKRVRA